MKFKKNTFFAILMVVSPLLGLLPVKPTGFFKPDNNYPLLIKNCSEDGNSIFYKVLGGKLTFNDSIYNKYRNIYTDTISITLSSYPKSIKDAEIFVKGTTVGFLYVEKENKYIANYDIYDWKPQKYIPHFTTWTFFQWIIFSVFCIGGVLILLKKRNE